MENIYSALILPIFFYLIRDPKKKEVVFNECKKYKSQEEKEGFELPTPKGVGFILHRPLPSF